MGNKFNFAEAREKAVRAADQELEQGMEKIVEDSVPGGSAASIAPVPEASASGKTDEPTKGVQTYIPLSDYLRLNTIKCHRGETIGTLVAQAIGLWLDVQEGKRKVSETT